jgi:hypothetical protein
MRGWPTPVRNEARKPHFLTISIPRISIPPRQCKIIFPIQPILSCFPPPFCSTWLPGTPLNMHCHFRTRPPTSCAPAYRRPFKDACFPPGIGLLSISASRCRWAVSDGGIHWVDTRKSLATNGGWAAYSGGPTIGCAVGLAHADHPGCAGGFRIAHFVFIGVISMSATPGRASHTTVCAS